MHGHNHIHHHHHHPDAAALKTGNAKPLVVGILLNGGFVILEAGYGFWGGSVALLADAGHNATDIIGLVIALLSLSISGHKPRGRFTYGFGSTTILAALGNGLLLLLAAGAIAWEAIKRLEGDAPVISGYGVIGVAGLAIFVNGATAWMLRPGGKKDLNVRAAYLHMLGDTLISLGVVIAGLAIEVSGYAWIDPVTSLMIVLCIFFSTWGLFKDSLQMMLGAVPQNIHLHEVTDFLESLPGVEKIHDLHVWPLSTQETALTVHLIMPGLPPGDAMLAQFSQELHQRFGIGHSTFQIEKSGKDCPLCGEKI